LLFYWKKGPANESNILYAVNAFSFSVCLEQLSV